LLHLTPSRRLPLRATARVLTLCLVALLVGGLLSPAAAAPRRVALGVSMIRDRDIATYDAFRSEAESGRAPALWSIWSDWGSPTTQFLPLDFMNHIRAQGSVPVIVWQPVDSSDKWNRAYSYASIRKGTHDAYIRAFAEQVDAYGGRVLIRFAHEFDGGWYPWGIGKPGNSMLDFKLAWKRIFRIFRDPETGLAKRARFVWSPQGSKDRDWMARAFPGSGFVDYLGFTALNWATYKDLPWYSLPRIVRHRMGLFEKLPRKRVIVTEAGSDFRRRSKAVWIRDGYAAVYRDWPRIVAISYFNVDMRETGDPNHPENWSLESPADGSAMRAYRELLRQTRFRGAVP
jgi:hypothetical protein